MARLNWKSLSLNLGITSVVMAIPGIAAASWPGYDLYSVKGYAQHPTQAYGLNAFAEIAGLAATGNNATAFDGLFGGAGYTSQITPRPSGWASLEFTGINDNLYMIGTGVISGHPTAIGAQYAGNVVNMTAGIPNLAQSLALGVNHHGEAVGSYNLYGSTDQSAHMFRWSSVSNSRTKDWTNYLPGGINEDGTIVANNLKPKNTFQLAELDFFPKTGNSTFALAPGGYLFIYPSGISTYGGITAIGQGAFAELNNSGTHLSSWAYNQTADQWSVLDAPGNPNFQANALAVDVWGTRIVGSTLDTNGMPSATVWENVNGQWVASYLSDIIPSQSNWVFEAATGINTYGAISGYGKHKEGETWIERAFVATPKAEFSVVYPEGGLYGGLTVNPTVVANGLNPSAVDLELVSNSDSARVSRDVVMPSMTRQAKFQLVTIGVDRPTSITLAVRIGGLEFGKPVLLLPAVLTSLTTKPNTDEAGAVGTVTLRGKGGPSGVVVNLTSSDPTVLVPASVNVQKGSSVGNFRITLARGAVKGNVATITATCAGRTYSQSFTIN